MQPSSTTAMAITEKFSSPPTSGSALLQFFAAAFRSEDIDSSSDEDEDQNVVSKKTDKDKTPQPAKDLVIRTDNLTNSGNDSEDSPTSPERPSDPSPITKPHLKNDLSTTPTDTRGASSGFSLGTVHDKEAVAGKLQAAFGYSKDEELVGEFSCWMARSVLLPGYMYLTTNHVCFYANLPSSHDVVQKEGFFSKKSKNTKSFSRFWFILKNDVLSYYADQTEIYYPIKTIDLRDALSAEPSPKNELTFYVYMRSRSRRYKFKTDSEVARADWVKAIQKSIFHAKMNDDSVKISIPLANLVDLEMNSTSFVDTIRLSIKDSDDVEDEFYFAYFGDTQKTLAALETQLDLYRESSKGHPVENLRFLNSTSPTGDSPRKSLAAENPQGPLASSLSGTQPETSQSASAVSWLNPLKYLHPSGTVSTTSKRSPSPTPHVSTNGEDESETTAKSPSFSIRGTATWIAEHTPGLSSSNGDVELEDDKQKTFRKDFSLPEGEALAETFSGYLLRVLPLYGRIYLSNNYTCFESTIKGTSTRVIVPLIDVEQVDRHRGTRFYFHGMSLLTKTGEEIFFEFSNAETRSTVLKAVRDRITPKAQERRRQYQAQAIKETPSLELDDPMESRVMDSLQLRGELVQGEPMSLVLHPGFKPSRPLHITCLTIGSRGDVQPYIALCKRLMEDGHKCRIATHGEYKEWVEGHGIEFGHVGGDPSQLIELCVENGMFTVSFIREALTKFRGWLDDLMSTAWEACQGTDVLIESPSAMAGIHIAEALEIPYFRAFPFPWTRTRAFPHPFAVPERSLGRGYNYMTYTMIEQVFWKGIASQVNKWRRRKLGIAPTSLERMEAHRVPSLYSWSPSLVPAPMDWHSWVHVTGYWFLDNPDHGWTPPEGLEEFLEADPDNKPVYIGFGSMVVSDPESMTKTIIDAVVKSGVRAIISKGWSDKLSTQEDGTVAVVQNSHGDEKVYPDSVYMLKSVPHDWLFHRLAGVVHHGGAGTTAAGLRAGIPTVIKPYFGDQFFWAQRLEDAGVGVWCHDLTVKKLTAALETITKNEKMIRKAQTLGERIRAEDGVGKAIQYFYHDLVIAKQNVERRMNEKEAAAATVGGESAQWLPGLSSSKATTTKTTKSEDVHKTYEHECERGGLSAGLEDKARVVSAPDLQQAIGEDDHIRQSATVDAEPKRASLQPSATEPGPDRASEMIKNSDKSAEGLAAELEAMQPFHPHPPQFTFHEGDVAWNKEHEISSHAKSSRLNDDISDNNDSSSGSRTSVSNAVSASSGDTSAKQPGQKKKKSKARRVFGSLATKARKVKDHFHSSSSTETKVVPNHKDASANAHTDKETDAQR